METIERLHGYSFPIPPEPFIPEEQLRPLTEADFQRLFEEFCALPVVVPPEEYCTVTTASAPEPAAMPEKRRRRQATDLEKPIGMLKQERYVTITAAARILQVSRPTIYAMIDRGELELFKLGPNTNRIDIKAYQDRRNSFPPATTSASKIELERKKYLSLPEAAETYHKDPKTIKAQATEAGVPLAFFNGAAHFSRKGLRKLYPGEKEKHDYLTVDQLAQECGISKQTVYDFIHDHKLPRKKDGRTVLIDRRVWEAVRRGHASEKQVKFDELQRERKEARKKGYVTISDASRHFGIHRGNLYYYAKKHKLKTLRLGEQVFYDKKQLYNILQEEYVSHQSNTPEKGAPER